MTSTTITATSSRTARPADLALGLVSGVALVAAGIWNVLVQEHLTVAGSPVAAADASPAQIMRQHYDWYASTVSQERAVTVLGIIGVVGLALLAVSLRRQSAASSPLAAHGCTTLALGSAVWVTGQLVALGGHRAVALMATHGNPIEGVNSIAFTVDSIATGFSAAAFLLFAAAMTAIGLTSEPTDRAWSALTCLAGATSLLVALGYLHTNETLTTYVLGALAALLMPVWCIWTGRKLSDTTDD